MCFVRVRVSKEGQKTKYVVAEIINTVERKDAYKLGSTITNYELCLKHGSQVQNVQLLYISNHRFTEIEFVKWYRLCYREGVPLPPLTRLQRKRREFNDAMNFEYTEAAVAKIIERKKKFRKWPINYAKHKSSLLCKRDDAIRDGNFKQADKHTKEIDKVDNRTNELYRRRTAHLCSFAYINERNRQETIRNAEFDLWDEIDDEMEETNE